MRVNSLFLGFICLMCSTTVEGQSDFSNWAGVEAKFDLSKDWKVGVEAQSRTDLKLGRFDALLLSPSISWELAKHFEADLSYRLTSVPYSNSTTNRVEKHRITADFSFVKIEKFFLKKKTRLGMSLRLRGTTEHQAEERTENTLRLKFKLEYNLPKTKLDLFASTEVFYRFQRDLVYTFTEVEAVNAIDKYRVKFGIQQPLGDQHSIKLFGMHQWRYPDGTNEIVIGLGYSFSLRAYKK